MWCRTCTQNHFFFTALLGFVQYARRNICKISLYLSTSHFKWLIILPGHLIVGDSVETKYGCSRMNSKRVGINLIWLVCHYLIPIFQECNIDWIIIWALLVSMEDFQSFRIGINNGHWWLVKSMFTRDHGYSGYDQQDLSFGSIVLPYNEC